MKMVCCVRLLRVRWWLLRRLSRRGEDLILELVFWGIWMMRVMRMVIGWRGNWMVFMISIKSVSWWLM